MRVRLQDYMTGRHPIFIRERDGVIYFQTQIEVARDDGLRAGHYLEFEKIRTDSSPEDIGNIARRILKRFHEIGDISLQEFESLSGTDMETYKKNKHSSIMSFVGAKDDKALERNYRECSIRYYIPDSSYELVLFWCYKRGRRYYKDSSDSTGKTDVLTFDTPLKFDDNVSSEELGKMILEALDRSRKMCETMSK